MKRESLIDRDAGRPDLRVDEQDLVATKSRIERCQPPPTSQQQAGAHDQGQ